MQSRNTKKIIWFIVAVVVGLLIIVGSYVIGNSRQEERLAEQAQQYSGVESAQGSSESSESAAGESSLDAASLVESFNKDRTETTAAAYLAYVASQDQEPTVTSIVTDELFEDVNAQAVNGLAEQGLEGISYNRLNYNNRTINDLNSEGLTEQLSESQPSLLIVNLPVETVFNIGADLETITGDIDALHSSIRNASPETLVVYAIMPATSQELAENEDYTQLVEGIVSHLNESSYNIYSLGSTYLDTQEPTEKYSEGQLSVDGLETLPSLYTQLLINSPINATTGFNGDNDDTEESEAESESEEIIEEPIIEDESSEESEPVTTTETTEEVESLPTEYVEVAYLLEGDEEVVQEGVDRVTEVTYEVVILDGVEQSREEIGRVVITEGQPRVVNIGTWVPENNPEPSPEEPSSSAETSYPEESQPEESSSEVSSSEDTGNESSSSNLADESDVESSNNSIY